MIGYLQAVGVADVLLPFLLIFTVAFAILQKTKVLGEKPEVKRYNLIVALVMGMAVVVPHVVWGTADNVNIYLSNGAIDPVKLINNSLPSVSIVIVAILMVMLLLGIFGAELDLNGRGINVGILVFSFATVIYVFGTNAGFFGNGNFPRWLWFLADPGTQSLLIVILVFGIIVWFITKEEQKEKDENYEWRKYIKPITGGGGKE
jgi:hypothetical protein